MPVVVSGFNRTFVAALMIAGAVAAPMEAQQPLPRGVPACLPGAERTYLEPDALQCWFGAAPRRWRILSHDSHYNTRVFHVGAESLQEARAIAESLLKAQGNSLGEMLLYVYLEPIATSSQIRRFNWSRGAGFSSIDFEGQAPEWIRQGLP